MNMYEFNLYPVCLLFRVAFAVAVASSLVAALRRAFVPWLTIQGDLSYISLTLIIGALLLLRVSAARSRFWQKTSLLRRMMGDWLSIANIIFSCPSSDFSAGVHQTLVRFLSLLNAVIIVDLDTGGPEKSCQCDVLDADGIQVDLLIKLAKVPHRPEVVCQWVQGLILECVHVATLNVPSALVPQVIRHMENGMNKFHETLVFVEPTSDSAPVVVLLMVHSAVTLFVGSTGTSFILTFLTMLVLWSLHFAACEIESPAGLTKELHTLQSQLNDRLVSMVDETTKSIPRLTFGPDEAMQRLQDRSLRSGEFHQHMSNMLHSPREHMSERSSLSTRDSSFFFKRIISHPPVSALKSNGSKASSTADRYKTTVGEILTSVIRFGRSEADADDSSVSSLGLDDDQNAQNGLEDQEAMMPVDTPTTSGVSDSSGFHEHSRLLQIISNIKVGVLSELDPKAKATHYLSPGEKFFVKQEHWICGVRYFELLDGGFVSERSRKQPEKIVVGEIVFATDEFVADAFAATSTCDNYEM